jgi:hypothetical protein
MLIIIDDSAITSPPTQIIQLNIPGKKLFAEGEQGSGRNIIKGWLF